MIFKNDKKSTMKKTVALIRIKSFLLLFCFTLFQLALFAQDQQGSSTTTTHSSTSSNSMQVPGTADNAAWYTSPWVWIVGAAVFILLLVALLSNRGTNRSDRVIVKKTVERDVDPDL
jgi:cytochrome bd-type quinol oxidase subunit 2